MTNRFLTQYEDDIVNNNVLCSSCWIRNRSGCSYMGVAIIAIYSISAYQVWIKRRLLILHIPPHPPLFPQIYRWTKNAITKVSECNIYLLWNLFILILTPLPKDWANFIFASSSPSDIKYSKYSSRKCSTYRYQNIDLQWK